uniref:Uncharacterized protein n=1 Tax=Octopus bimaculoides TaxID=37653 RepID=A0A0L8FZA0_OCTBM
MRRCDLVHEGKNFIPSLHPMSLCEVQKRRNRDGMNSLFHFVTILLDIVSLGVHMLSY